MSIPKGAQGKTFLALPVEDPADAVMVEICVTNWSHTVTRKTQPSTTTCNYDEDDDTVYEDEDEVSRGLSFEFTGFTDLTTSQEAILKAKTLGETWLLLKSGKYIDMRAAIITSIKFMGSDTTLQTFQVSAKAKGKFNLFSAGPPPTGP